MGLKAPVDQWLSVAGVPSIFSGARQSHLAKSIRAVKMSKAGILFQGPNGVGKTYAAVALLRAMLEKNAHRCAVWFYDNRGELCQCGWRQPRARMVNARRLVSESRDAYEAESAVRQRYVDEPGVLLLDDIASVKISEWSLSILYIVIAGRGDAEKPTIATIDTRLLSYLGPREREVTGAQRLTSRLGAYSKVVMEGEDRRAGA